MERAVLVVNAFLGTTKAEAREVVQAIARVAKLKRTIISQ